MSQVPIDVINKLTTYQSQIWQTVSLTVSESCGNAVNFASPLTVSAKTADMYGEMGSPMMVIQFAFASQPENPVVILIPQEAAHEIASLVQGDDVEEIDENVMADVRPTLEGIVQGICLAIGNIKNETIVASGLSIRFQIFSFPPNFQKAVELARTQVAVTGEGLSGTAIWLMDPEVAHYVCGIPMSEESESLPFTQVSAPTPDGAAPAPAPRAASHDDTHGLDLLLDIPLEISVELGRVKMLVKDVVDLGTGSIIEIDKAAGEPVDVMVNGRLVARGEVVVIEDNFGVRITEIISPQERLTRLGDAA